ncbi:MULTISPECIES: phage scaffolding protein [Asaia]|uniref:phage scaffolding protein n=1 Tax=Asaia TaxID=91914 RepID=UPI002FC3A131
MSEPTEIDPNTVRELERARADLKTLRAELKGVQEDADRARKERDGFKGQMEKQRAEQDAKLAEAAAANDALRAENETAMTELRSAGDKALMHAKAEAIATRLGAHDPADVVRLLDLSAVKRSEDGAFEGLAEVLEAAKESKAYLFGEPPKTGAEQGTTRTAPAPQPGKPEPVNARTMATQDYEARKRQFLAS